MINTFEKFMSSEHTGKRNAVTSREIEAKFRCKGTEVRKMVNDLRCQGVPICSCSKGYFYAETEDEVRHTIAHLDGRITAIEAARSGMNSVLNKYKGG